MRKIHFDDLFIDEIFAFKIFQKQLIKSLASFLFMIVLNLLVHFSFTRCIIVTIFSL